MTPSLDYVAILVIVWLDGLLIVGHSLYCKNCQRSKCINFVLKRKLRTITHKIAKIIRARAKLPSLKSRKNVCEAVSDGG